MWPFKNEATRQSEIVSNATTLSFRDLLSSAIGKSHGGNRDTWEIFGYKRNRTFKDYNEMFLYNGYANRIVKALPKSCWRDGFTITDDEDDVLEDELRILNRCGLSKMLEKADILNRIGSYSILYVGVPDGLEPDQPLGSANDLEEVYFAAYAEDSVTVSKYNKDPLSKRYGMPELYSLTPRVDDQQSTGGIVDTRNTIKVHWSRIVHLAEDSLDNDLIGISSLAPVLNRLQDLDKSIGGSSEAYFRNARGKIVFTAGKGFDGFRNETEQTAFKTLAQNFTNGWQDSISLVGINAKNIDTPYHDPNGTVKVALQAISGQTGIPIRILTGEGAGQLAGNEDRASYNQLIDDRQRQVCSQWVYRVMVILSDCGLIDFEPTYDIDWPLLESLDDKEKSEIRSKDAQAFKAVADALSTMALDGVVNINDVFEKVLGVDLDLDIDESDIGEPLESDL